jgi:hypothetical protein
MAFTVGTTVETHDRSITLKLRRHLVARGRVSVPDGFAACRSGVTVKIQRLRLGEWRTVGSDLTNANGRFREPIADVPGRYRAVTAKFAPGGGDDVCRRAVATVRIHRHG